MTIMILVNKVFQDHETTWLITKSKVTIRKGQTFYYLKTTIEIITVDHLWKAMSPAFFEFFIEFHRPIWRCFEGASSADKTSR